MAVTRIAALQVRFEKDRRKTFDRHRGCMIP
jgi:hypothetical protein